MDFHSRLVKKYELHPVSTQVHKKKEYCNFKHECKPAIYINLYHEYNLLLDDQGCLYPLFQVPTACLHIHTIVQRTYCLNTIVSSLLVHSFSIMDTSTILFMAALAAAFLILRWLIRPIPQSVPEEFNVPDPTQRHEQPSRRQRPTGNRAVTDLMIEVVQAMAPQLTVSQIRHSLQRTGSVEATVNEYMDNGDLPFPPGESAVRVTESVAHNKKPLGASRNLLEKYGITDADLLDPGYLAGVSAKGDREDVLQKRRAEMIVRARKRMEQSLTGNLL